MTWFRVDDTLAAHPKARSAGLPALGLWVVAGSWSSQQLTEGLVPVWFVETWPRGRKLASSLVAAGLWVETQEGWQFHDWTDCNPTAETERARRKAAAERQKRAREKAAAMRDADRDSAVDNMQTDTRESRATSRVTNAASHAPPYPTRPDPSLGSSVETSGGNGSEVDGRDGDEPPRCIRHNNLPRYEEPPCKSCERLRIQWEETRSADQVFERPPWCGRCDQWSRKVEIEIDGRDAMQNCPTCHPLAATA